MICFLLAPAPEGSMPAPAPRRVNRLRLVGLILLLSFVLLGFDLSPAVLPGGDVAVGLTAPNAKHEVFLLSSSRLAAWTSHVDLVHDGTTTDCHYQNQSGESS